MDYYIYKDDQNVGPLSEREVSDGLRSGRFLSDDLGCRVGEDRWVDLDFFFPSTSNQTHTWIEPSPPGPPAFENRYVQRQLTRQTSPHMQMPPPLNHGVVYQQPTYVVQPIIVAANKSRVSYILLGIFLGGLGIHNFYAGYSGRGVAQLLLTLFLFWTIVVPIVVWIWVIIEVISVDRDAYGNRFS